MKEKVRIGVIIPSRGTERVKLLRNSIRMLAEQTLEPTHVECMVHAPKSDQVDITERYRRGYSFFSPDVVDLIAFWEDDDWMAPDYLEYMADQWVKQGKPDLFGTNYTIYYHIKLKKYFTFRHSQRASAMNTFIKPGLQFTWPKDNDPYTDAWLWRSEEIKSRIAFEPDHIISVGIKHGVGMTGGMFHVNKFHKYINDDNGFLKNTLDEKSYSFYTKFAEEEISINI